MHGMFQGNVETILKEIREHGWDRELYGDIKPKPQYLNTDSLIPLETQRKTYDKWILKVLEKCGGFDWVAFNSLSVAHDTSTGKYYVFDGCGRLALAQIYGIEQVPCLVFELTQRRAAHYFAYMQDDGRRKMDPETLFVNKYYSGNTQAELEYARLMALDCYIIGATEYSVPQQCKQSYASVKHAFLTRGYVRAGGNPSDTVNNPEALNLMRESVDLIKQAWFPKYQRNLRASKRAWTPETGFQIRQDLYMGLIKLLQIYPEFRPGVNSKMHGYLAEYLRDTAKNTHQRDLPYKKDGGNEHNHEDLSVANGLFSYFWKSLADEPHENWVKQRVPLWKMESAVAALNTAKVETKTSTARRAGAVGGQRMAQVKIAQRTTPSNTAVLDTLLSFNP
jgi:hypothetical protein